MSRPALRLAAACAAIALVGGYLGNQLRLQNVQNAQLELRVAELETSREAAAARAVPVHAGVEATGSNDATPASEGAPVGAQVARPSLQQSMQSALQSPEGRNLMRMVRRNALEQRYADMAKSLNLTPAQVDKVLDFLAEHEMEMDTLNSQFHKTRDRTAREELGRVISGKQQAYMAELSNLLGNSYPQWQAYDLAASDRQREGYVKRGEDLMRTTIVAGGSPISDAQFQTLTAAMRAEESRFNQEVRGQSVQQQVQRMPELIRRQAEAAAPYLDADQLARLRKHLDQVYGSAGTMMDMNDVLGMMDEEE